MNTQAISLRRTFFSDYIELTKPRINLFVVLTTWIGYCLGSSTPLDYFKLLHTLLGTAFVVAGSGVLNQWIERDVDARMKRTANRPLPAGRLRPESALLFGLILPTIGVAELLIGVNFLSGLLAALAFFNYLFLYTPLKLRTPLCTVVGAVSGAIPPLIGWVAVRGEVKGEGWILFGVLFLWQIPHFLSLACLYREDYCRAGLRMLPVMDKNGNLTHLNMVLCTLGLFVVSQIPFWTGLAGNFYFLGSLMLGGLFIVLDLRCALNGGQPVQLFHYRRVFYASLIYLPVLLTLLMVDKI